MMVWAILIYILGFARAMEIICYHLLRDALNKRDFEELSNYWGE